MKQISELLNTGVYESFKPERNMTVKQLLEELSLDGQLVGILVNGERVKPDKMIKKTDDIVIIPCIAGGMKYIESPNNYMIKNYERSIFFAGGITNCPNWQQKLANLLASVGNLVILNPRRENFPIDDPHAVLEQITWEFKKLHVSDMISFWFSRGSLNPIVLFELGKWLAQKEKPIFIGIDHPQYLRKIDVQIQTALERPDIKIVYSLEDLANQIRAEMLKHV